MSLLTLALRRPLTIVVLALAVVLGAVVAIQRMPRDIFPPLGIPTIYVAQPYGGMDPAQMEGYLTYRYEYHFLYISNIEHVESKSIQGASIMKLQFHPGTDMSQAMSETVAQVNRSRAFMPPGTVAPFIMRFDAGSVAVGNLVFSTDRPDITLNMMQDQALNKVRPSFATLPGVSAPPPFGGSSRAIVVNVDPDKMRAAGLSPDEIVQSIARANTISPSGNINLNGKYPIVPTNAIVKDVKELEGVALKTEEGRAVFVRDIATVSDSADVTTSYALANGKRTVYLPVTKRAEASTLEVVKTVRANIPEFQKLLPEGISVSYEFDQSPVVERSIRDLLKEGALGAVLTGLMILVFLRDWRSAFIVVINIPLALLASCLALWVSGQSIHLMTLGGLALAVGILVDEATVAVENIHSHLARGASLAEAAAIGTRETTIPRFLAMVCILAVFVPAFFMVGAAKALFIPLALAVGFAMVASFFLSSTLVPILSVWVLRSKHRGAGASEKEEPNLLRSLISPFTKASVAARWIVVPAYLAGMAAILLLIGPFVGREIFPQTDSGQFALRFRAPSGTQVATTEKLATRILDLIAHEAGGADQVAFSIGMVGVHNSSFPVNLVHLWNGGPGEGFLAIQLAGGTKVRIDELKETLRAVFAKELPDVKVSFEPQDIVSRVMSFGSPTPIEVAVSGGDLNASKAHAQKLLAEFQKIPALRDVQIAQDLEFPTVNVQIDRERAGLLGVEVEDIARSLVAATTSSRFTVPNFWADPKTGISFNIQVQIPEERTQSLEDLRNTPIRSKNGTPVLLRNLVDLTETTSIGTYERYNLARVVSITANLHDTDFGRAIKAVEKAIQTVGPPVDGKTKVDVRGQVVPYRQLSLGFSTGLLIAIVSIFLLLCANFQSVRLALVVVATLPAVLAGIVIALWITGTTLNIQSGIGAIMAVGVAVANAILLVTFSETIRRNASREGQADPVEAAIAGARSRVRAVAMTSCAMISGMLPLALGLGEGGDQTAPLGRAVVGGLVFATIATLLILPAFYALLAGKKVRSPSLDPEDPESVYFDHGSQVMRSTIGILLAAGGIFLWGCVPAGLENIPSAAATPANQSAEENSPFENPEGNYRIDLASTLRLAAGRNLELAKSVERVQLAAAKSDQAALSIVPDLAAGASFARQNGLLQEIGGAPIETERVNRSAGLGTSSGVPGVGLDLNLSKAIFDPLAAKQDKRAAEAASEADSHRILAEAAAAYFELVRASGHLRLAREIEDASRKLADSSEAFARAGEGLNADAERAMATYLLRQGDTADAEADLRVRSAALSKILHLPGTLTFIPQGDSVAATHLVSADESEARLVATALRCRPEAAAMQAEVSAAAHRYTEKKIQPFLPNLAAGYSSYEFAAGQGVGADRTDPRDEVTALIYWKLDGLGFGDEAAAREKRSELALVKIEEARVLDEISFDVTTARAEVLARRARLPLGSRASQHARRAYELTTERLRQSQGLPIEALASIQTLAEARRAEIDAVLDYNIAQHRLLAALGHPSTK